MEIGSKLHHWRFGPLTVTAIEENSIIVQVDDPSGLVNTQLGSIPKRILFKYIDHYFFQNQNLVIITPKVEYEYLHKNYSSIFPQNPLRNKHEDFLEQITKYQKEIEAYENEIQNTDREMLNMSRRIKKYEEEIINLLQLIQDLQTDLIRINDEIANIDSAESPREIKEILPQKPMLEKKRSQLQFEINNYYKRLDRKITSISDSNSKLSLMVMNKQATVQKITITQTKIDSLNNAKGG